MNRLLTAGAIVMFLCLLVLGCATMSDVLAGRNDGTANVYLVKADIAWELAITTLRLEGSKTIEEHKESRFIFAKIPATSAGGGCLVGVWVDPVSEDNTKITVVTKRKDPTSIFTVLTETGFHRRFAHLVEVMKLPD